MRRALPLRNNRTETAALASIDVAAHQFLPSFTFATPQGNLEKIRSAEGSAYIDFRVNRTEIDPEYRRNPSELGKIQATVDKVLNDPDVTIVGMRIKGFASPEGSYANNVRLASGRAQTLADYVRRLYSFPEEIMKISSVPENWEGLRAYVAESDMADKDRMLEIIDNTSLEPDPREAAFKKAFPTDYAFLLKNVYPGLRRSDYAVEYTVRDFTSIDEIKRMMIAAPEKLSAAEVFAVANTLNPDSQAFREAISLAYALNPELPETNLNMAIIALRDSDPAKATPYLTNAGYSPAADYARGVCAYLEGDTGTALRLVGQAAEAGIPDAIDALDQLKLITWSNKSISE